MRKKTRLKIFNKGFELNIESKINLICKKRKNLIINQENFTIKLPVIKGKKYLFKGSIEPLIERITYIGI